MTSGSVRITHAVFRLAVALSPPDRKEWSRAMQAEMIYASDDKALPFAFGCLWAMAGARVAASRTILNAAHWTLVLGAIAWSALHLRLAGQFSAVGAEVSSTLAYLAAVAIALGALLTAAKGLRAAIILAVPVIFLAALVAIGADELLPGSTFTRFYRAIAIEYVVILLVAMMIATGVPRWVDQRERHIG